MQPTFVALCVALGIGLLVGAERERRKDSSPDRGSAGIRTFAIVSLLGAVGMLVGGVAVLALVVFITGLAAMAAYVSNHREDKGITTEMALVLNGLLGGLAVVDALLAAEVGVLLALLLFARKAIHHFVRALLTEQDLQDALVFAGIALIVLPLAPDAFMGPLNALNPRHLVLLVVVMLAISACGYVGSRWLGPRYGLPLAGFSSGFVSSVATTYSMGQRGQVNGVVSGPAVAGAALSSIATFVQMSVLIGLVAPQLLRLMALPLLLGGAAALSYGLWCLYGSDSGSSTPATAHPEGAPDVGRAFDLQSAVAFAGVLTLVMMVSAGLNAWLGERGVALAAMVAGLADAHATAASTASLIAAGEIKAQQAVLPILLGLSANTLTKAVVAYQAGGVAYLCRMAPGLALMMVAVWAGYGVLWLSS
ncbi:DUF4010 domain-containing protein [Rhodoferax sp. OV413]|uniref:MgtC/SapB family protein n=1 Tax=Rhodoferax sp. OV413 TaxID=1855285 RepID=UPI0025D60928|nr:DUF4010 domain-containing protein [Rhodoferax sp. OV413]